MQNRLHEDRLADLIQLELPQLFNSPSILESVFRVESRSAFIILLCFARFKFHHGLFYGRLTHAGNSHMGYFRIPDNGIGTPSRDRDSDAQRLFLRRPISFHRFDLDRLEIVPCP